MNRLDEIEQNARRLVFDAEINEQPSDYHKTVIALVAVARAAAEVVRLDAIQYPGPPPYQVVNADEDLRNAIAPLLAEESK